MKPSRLTTDQFDQLAAATGENLVSIAIPTHRRGRDVAQDPVRLKNELAEVDAQLEERGMKPRQRDQLLQQATETLDDVEFWEHQADQLAVFIEDDGSTTTLAVSEETGGAPSHVGDRFYVRYVLPDLDPILLPVLVLTQNFVGLYSADLVSARRLEVDLPESLEDVNWFVDRESQRQQHPDRAGSQRNRHGHEPSADREADLDRFLRAVARELPESLPAPLVVLGDDPVVGRFAQTYEGEMLSPEHSGTREPSDSVVHEIAFPTLEEHRRRVRASAAERAAEALGTGSATPDASEAIREARQGRIGELVLTQGSGAEADDDPEGEGSHYLRNEAVIEAHQTGAKLSIIDDAVDGNELVEIRRY